MKNKSIVLTAFIFAVFLFAGWGAVGHKLINRKTPQFFPPQMNAFQNWRDSLAVHASDADSRKNTDSTESRRHYIDIDAYSGFIINHRIPQNIDSLNNIYGYNVVISNGIVPFAIIAYTDSVKQAFSQHNFQKAMLKSADLGHYVGDAHNPLHDTRWYNGWSTFSNEIHSRYETGLISRDSAFIQYTGDSIYYVNDINQYAFNIVYNTYVYVDSVYRCDSIAHTIAGNTNSTQFYQEFWNRAGNFTIMLFKNASKSLASLIYTAWVNAGSPVPTTGVGPIAGNIKNYKLYQNYPNPFNPSTKIKFDVLSMSNVKLSVYDITGKQISSLVNEKLNPGEYEVNFNALNLPSGTYIYKLQTDSYSEARRMLLIK
jgi:hypothetical protein